MIKITLTKHAKKRMYRVGEYIEKDIIQDILSSKSVIYDKENCYKVIGKIATYIIAYINKGREIRIKTILTDCSEYRKKVLVKHYFKRKGIKKELKIIK